MPDIEFSIAGGGASVTEEVSHDTAARVGAGFIYDVLVAKLAEARVLIEKQAAYGPYNIARPPHGITPEVALAVRINDKVQRLGTLLTADDAAPAGSESRLDSWGDIANYGTIGTLVEEGRWPGLDAVANGRLPGEYPAPAPYMEEGAPEDPLDQYRWAYPAG